MKKVCVAALCMVAASAWADRQVQLSSGTICWLNQRGEAYNCTRQAPAVDARTGQVYAPAGQGYVGQDGRYFAPAGPGAVVDTRTGQVIPIWK